MEGYVFTIIILTILAAAGFLFAWAIRLASGPKNSPTKPKPNLPSETDSPSRPIF